MPYEIHVKGKSPVSDNAAVKTAFSNLMTALRGLAGGKSVDAGGTYIDGDPQFGDEVDPVKNHKRFGETF